MNNLAKAFVAPRDFNPVRLPSTVREPTGTVRIYHLDDIMPINCNRLTVNQLGVGVQAVVAVQPPSIGSHGNFYGTLPVFTRRCLINPVIYPTMFLSTISALGTFLTTSTPGGAMDTSTALIYELPVVNASPSAPVIFTIPEDLGVPEFACYKISGGMPGPFSTPVSYYSERTNRWYFMYGGGTVDIVFKCMYGTGSTLDNVEVPPGGGLEITLTLYRYTATAGDENCGNYKATIAAGAKQVSLNLLIQQVGTTVECESAAGYYRYQIDTVHINAPTAKFEKYSLQIEHLIIIDRTQWYWYAPVPSAVLEGPYMTTQYRVTSVGTLLTNVASTYYARGGASGAALPERVLWCDASVPSILNRAGAVRTGYRGAARNGMYTWLEPHTNMEKWYSASINRSDDMSNVSNQAVLIPYMRAGSAVTSSANIIICQLDNPFPVHCSLITETQDQLPGLDNGWYAGTNTTTTGFGNINTTIGGTASMFQLRVDIHVEYVSNSQLCTMTISPHLATDFERCTMTLANVPLFTENWIHLEQLWNAIKNGGKVVLKAGASAAGRALLSELAAGLAAVAL